MKSIHCPSCDTVFQLRDDQVNPVVTCPKCHNMVDAMQEIDHRYCGTCEDGATHPENLNQYLKEIRDLAQRMDNLESILKSIHEILKSNPKGSS